MSWLTRLFRRDPSADAEATRQVNCGHSSLMPRWDRREDMGKEELSSGFTCVACGSSFTREEAQAMGAPPGA
jgi:hypothetical protein